MTIGQQVMVIGTVGRAYYTAWFAKAADNGVFTYEIVHENFGTGDGVGLTVTVYTKNREDAGSEGSSYTFSQIGAQKFFQAFCGDLKQLVRFKIEVVPGESPSGPEGVHVRFLAPTWYDKAV